MQDTRIAKNIEPKVGKGGGAYVTVTWDNGKKDNVNKEEWITLLVESLNSQTPITYTKEKKGDFWVIKTMALVGEAQAPKPESATQPVAQVKPQAPIYGSDIAPQERGMWWKEVGECIRSGAINKETPAGLQMMVAYYTEMRRVLGIMTGKEVNTKQKKALVEQAKKQGATEIKTEIENEN